MIVEGTKEIPVYKGGDVVAWAQVDAEDYERLSLYRWNPGPKGCARRSVRVEGRVLTVFLHREVLSLNPGDPWIDHEDRNPLNCRKANLRFATAAQNGQNRRGWGSATSSYRGVCWAAGKNKWRATSRLAGVQVHIGYFDSEAQAGQAAADWRAEHMAFSEEAISA